MLTTLLGHVDRGSDFGLTIRPVQLLGTTSISMQHAADFIAESARQHVPMAFFVGAAVSKAAPSLLPLWKDFRDAVLAALFDRLAQTGYFERAVVEELAHDLLTHLDRCSKSHEIELRPEVVLERLFPYLSKTVRATLRVFDHGDPNLNHHVLAALATSSRALVATCNFDVMIEKASGSKLVSYSTPRATRNDRSFREYVALLDSPRAHSALRPPLLKIHGCAASPNTVKATLSQVSRPVPRSHRDALKKLVQNRLLVVAGYRGDDSDILPEIARAAPLSRGVVWLAWNPQQVPDEVRGPGTTIATGDLNEFFRTLATRLDIKAKSAVAVPVATLADTLRQAVAGARPIDVCIALSELANHIGCWSTVDKLAGRAATLTSDPRLRALAYMSLADAKRHENPSESLRFAKLAARTLRRYASRHPRDYGHCLKYVAAQENLLGVSKSALAVNARAIGWIKQACDPASLARALDDRANILRRLGDISSALRTRHQAIHVLERVGDRLNLAMVYSNLGKDYDTENDFVNAEIWWRKSLAMKERESCNAPDVGRTRFNLAELLRSTGRFNDSLHFMAGAWRMARMHGDRVVVARSLYGLAALAHTFGKATQAQRLLAAADFAAKSAPHWNAYPGRQKWARSIRRQILRSTKASRRRGEHQERPT